ncbi:hypothetical protein [Pelagimonas varians]|uniref:Uncharacterized protein n=1 Tax=Pelagimonas varians TaxID=696760 RepID=A0A238KR05_9RHOB|nr:hypothetical protein [Pelagimonas varians]PYG28582.1 hypothetical protein C8N36_11182 [Pelagimonas varians]SMX45289.1 hypothetical protein PEV8663_03003 [Pelagimonas varians]
MSCHDLRKGLTVSVPDGMRNKLHAISPANLPLGYLLRQSLLQSLKANIDWTTEVAAGNSQPLLIPLSLDERMQLAERIDGREVSEEVAVLSLVSAVLDQGPNQD